MAKLSIITGLDIGTNTIKILVAQKTPNSELEVLSQVREPSAGVRKGVIINVEKVSEIIQSALDKAERESGQRIDSAYVNIGGSHIFSISSHGLVSVSRADQKISKEDIDRVLQAAQTFSLPPNKEIFDVIPKEFIVDDERGIKEVLGMEGVRLEAEVLALGGFTPYLKNLTQAVLSSNLRIADLVPSPLAAARACLNSREKELGVALLDIGTGTTGLAVFEEGDLIHLAILPIGSSHITNDIAIGFKIDTNIAERIKIEYGSCFLKGGNKKEKIKISGEEPLVFSQKMLTKIIEARISEIFGEINKELKKISRQKSLPAGIVLTGGGSNLPKISELAKKELKLSCRVRRPKGFLNLEENPNLATICGLVLKGIDLEEEKGPGGGWSPTFGKGMMAKIKKIFRIFIP